MVRQILAHVLTEDDGEDERAEVQIGRNILRATADLRGRLPDPSPEQLRALTTIEAAARSLVRMHHLE
jgi:hypothetical protein